MELDAIVAAREPPNRHLDYDTRGCDPAAIAETLVGMANAEGGTVVVGVRVDSEGRPDSVVGLASRAAVREAVVDVLDERVRPGLDCRSEVFSVDGARLLAFTVAPGDCLRSFKDGDGKPVFPVRCGTGLRYLSGEAVSWTSFNIHPVEARGNDGARS